MLRLRRRKQYEDGDPATPGRATADYRWNTGSRFRHDHTKGNTRPCKAAYEVNMSAFRSSTRATSKCLFWTRLTKCCPEDLRTRSTTFSAPCLEIFRYSRSIAICGDKITPNHRSFYFLQQCRPKFWMSQNGSCESLFES